MPSLVTKRFRVHNAEQFHEAFSETASSKMYFFISRVTPWSNESSPPTPTENVEDVSYNAWKRMIAAKRIQTADTTFAVPRYNWVTGKVYRQYDSTSSTLYDVPASSNTFYVISSEYHVYKCLWNNKAATSTVEPTGTATAILNTADGYRWKYMYTVTAAENLKFVTTDWQPVKTLTSDDGSSQWDVQAAAANGSIEVIKVTAVGNGYMYNTGTLTAVNNTAATYTLAATANTTDDIYTGSDIYIKSGVGAGQVKTITDYNGTTKTISVATAFNPNVAITSVYSIGPKIAITGDGSSATAYANVATNTGINYINLIAIGSNYSNTTVTISANSSHGSGATAVAMMPPLGGHGSDPLNELAGHNVMMNIQLSGTESDTFMSGNDFRTMGVVRDPLLSSDGTTIATSSTYDQTTRLALTTVSAAGRYANDEIITGGTSAATARLISFANTNSANTTGTIKLTDVNGTFAISETITGGNTGITAVVSTITAGSLKKYTGDIIYLENRAAISRSADQIEDIKLTVKF